MSAPRFVARPLAETDAHAWDAVAEAHGSVFDSARWAGLFGPSLRRIGIFEAGGALRGGFSLWKERRLRLQVLRNPPFTPQIGPFLESRATNAAARTAEQRNVVEAMAAYLEDAGAAVISLGLSLGVVDCLPFYWRGYKVVPHYTHRIDLAQDEVSLLAAFSKERRNDIRKAEKDGIEVGEAKDTRSIRNLVTQTFARSGKNFPRAAMETIFAGFPPGERSHCFTASDRGRELAGVYVIHDCRTAYYLMGGYADNAHHGAGALAMWHAILRAKELGLDVFDFEGSMIPPIERYFRGFGGVLTPIMSVHKAWLPLEMGLKLIKRQLF